MIPRKNRLRQERDFSRVFREGKRAHTPHFFVSAAKGLTSRPRAAVIVAARVIKKAQKRNLWKRRIREVLRQFLPEIKKNWDFAVVLKKTPEEKPVAALAREIHTLLKNARVL